MIDSLGIKITKLQIIPVEGGDVLHGLKSYEEDFSSFGEIYFSTIKQNKIKAWKKHNEMTMNFVVPHGKVKFVIFKDPPRKNQYSEYIVSRDNYLRLNIPPNLWVGFSGVDSGESIVCNIADLNHDPKEVDKINLSEIDYSWKND
tara:strand:- start:17141 stop:17575 length:435 start_codon:yes stop_codon:yes gene_type:complete